MKTQFNPNSIDIPSNVRDFVLDAKNSKWHRNNPNKRILELANRCDGLVIAWERLNDRNRASLARQSAILYRLQIEA